MGTETSEGFCGVRSMSLKIRAIRNAGDLDKERIVLIADSEVDIGKYVLLAVDASGEELYSEIGAAFWLPDKEIRGGDLVVVYTKQGNNGVKRNKDNTRTYFYYWGLKDVNWIPGERAAVLGELRRWNTHFVEEE